MASIRIDIERVISAVDPRIYSGFTEHMGRCFRSDVMAVLKDLKIPIVRYPGGNFVSSYRWQDGRRPELAWLSEESNLFGTDEFIDFCRELGTEPFISWLEYCNSSANTYYANLRRKNGHEEPHNVKYWALGNEVWGPWQSNKNRTDYAKKAYQWAKALKLLDPTIKLVSCGETGYADWDRVTLRKLGSLYTVSEGKHAVNVIGPAAAEKALDITRSLIDLAKIEAGLEKDLTVCFDEWNKGAEEHYDLSDAIAVASWLNVFVRKADIVKIACIAQSVNVISPIITSPQGLFKQTTYYPLHLFTNLMRGASLFGPTVPTWIKQLDTHMPRCGQGRRRMKVYEVWSPQLGDTNGFEGEKVSTVEKEVNWEGSYVLKKHSFQELSTLGVAKLALTVHIKSTCTQSCGSPVDLCFVRAQSISFASKLCHYQGVNISLWFSAWISGFQRLQQPVVG
ncbi:glycoside hydrolase family 51 protein [Armillaria novae-zelandiae]|uniref:non-reducing end alpha-L-arabinofuranosidase n=1 Tax=Armillaria novae-zelandiae TaxID=153914 RepID=A0AA39UC97_9AGAR|nr:glycoside hydrolase family 51 protein [Armillaria novae-zelandiae]